MNFQNKATDRMKIAALLFIGLGVYFHAELGHLLPRSAAQDAQYLINTGALAVNQGNYKGAIEASDTALKRYPDAANIQRAYMVKGLALLKSGDKTDAIREFQTVAEKYPKTNEAQAAKNALHNLGASTSDGKTPPKPDTNTPPPGAVLGKWRGQGSIGKQGICTLTLEVRDEQDGKFSGFPSLTCMSLVPYLSSHPRLENLNPGVAVLGQMNPSTAILSGEWNKGSVVFRVDKVTGVNESGCRMTGFNITPLRLEPDCRRMDRQLRYRPDVANEI